MNRRTWDHRSRAQFSSTNPTETPARWFLIQEVSPPVPRIAFSFRWKFVGTAWIGSMWEALSTAKCTSPGFRLGWGSWWRTPWRGSRWWATRRRHIWSSLCLIASAPYDPTLGCLTTCSSPYSCTTPGSEWNPYRSSNPISPTLGPAEATLTFIILTSFSSTKTGWTRRWRIINSVRWEDGFIFVCQSMRKCS